MRILVTGAAGFIGAHISHALLDRDIEVVGVDNLNAYYDPKLKQDRLGFLTARQGFEFVRGDLADPKTLTDIPGTFDSVVHLAAQAGVRHSIDAPFDYLDSNLRGHLSVLEFVRNAPKRPFLVYASSSSVYGDNTPAPFKETARADEPVSLYAATKRSVELISTSYTSLYDIAQVGLRFFTVYGPWGRPDMAYFKFADAMMSGREIEIYNHGDLMRDFTWIDDIVSAVIAIVLAGPEGGNGAGRPHRVYNIGNNRPERLMDFVDTLERAFEIEAIKVMRPMQPGDVTVTAADIDSIKSDYGFSPSTSIDQGLSRFADWFKAWHAGEQTGWRSS